MTYRMALLLCAAVAGTSGLSCAEVTPPAAGRVSAIEKMLPEKPAGIGVVISRRIHWDRWAREPAYRAVVIKAEELMTQPVPEQPDHFFLAYLESGKYPQLQEAMNARRGRIAPLVLAECVENKGRFIPAIEAALKAVCSEKTWILPPSDKNLENFKGNTTDIDIGSANLASDVAEAAYLLEDRLSPEVRQLIRENLQKRIIEPFQLMAGGKKPLNMWMTKRNNLNAVCLAGISVVGLSQIESRSERAEFLANVEKYSKYYLEGFPADGYCTEGLGYWNYGFGHYLLLADTIRRQTAGKIDLLAPEKTRNVAAFGAKIQILDGIAPAFADSPTTMKASVPVMSYLNRRFQMGLAEYETFNPGDTFYSLLGTMVYTMFPLTKQPELGRVPGPSLRDWFDSSGVLVARPAPGAESRFGIAFKGGNNVVGHNHTDLGSYVVVNNGRALLLDPGRENYTIRTFGPKRYEGPLLNSWGHGVPLVAKKLQSTGAAAKAVVLEKSFTEEEDAVTYDLSSAYAVPELEKLERKLVYSRGGAGEFTVIDQFQFKTPQEYGTALITLGSWEKQADGSLVIYDVDQAVSVRIDTGGAEYTVDAEKIREDAPVNPTRIGINLKEPALTGSIQVSIRPLQVPAAKDGPLVNGDFERGTWGWQLHDGLAELSSEKAYRGKKSLKINDPDATRFAVVNSARIPVSGSGSLEISGYVNRQDEMQVDVFANCYDAAGSLVSPVDAMGQTIPIGSLKPGLGSWQRFGIKFVPPAGTREIMVSFKSLAEEKGVTYLDKVELSPAK